MPVELTLPWAPWLTAVTLRVWPASLAGPRLSLVRGSRLTEPSSATLAESLTAVGLSLTSVTVRLMVFAVWSRSTPPLAVPPSSWTWKSKDA